MVLSNKKKFRQIRTFNGYCMTGSNTDHNNHHTVKGEYKIFRNWYRRSDPWYEKRRRGRVAVVLHGLQFGVQSIAGSGGNTVTCFLN